MDEQQMTLTERLNRRAFYGSLVTAVFMFVVLVIRSVFSSPLESESGRDISLTILIIVPLISAVLARNGRSRLGIWLIITFVYLVGFVAVFALYANFAVAGALFPLLVSGGLASYTLKQKDINRTIVVTFAASLLILLGDTLSPIQRPPYPAANFLTIVIITTALLYGFFIYQQFHRYTLQVKLTMIMLGITILSIGAIGVTISSVVRQNLTKQVEDSFILQVENLADFMGAIFLQKVSQMQAVAAVDVIKVALEEQNEAYSGDETAILAGIQATDGQWVVASDDDPLIRSVVARDKTINPIAFQLYDFLETFPEQSEIFVTDKYGATVGATGRLSDYYQADEAWWQAAWNDGQGAIHISEPIYDESADVVALYIALPVVKEDGEELLGIVRSTLILDVFFEPIAAQRLGATGHSFLLTHEGNVIFEGAITDEGGNSQNLLAEFRQNMARATVSASVITLDEHNDESIFAYAPARVEGYGEREVVGESEEVEALSEFETAVAEAVQSLGWVVALRQKTDEAFATVTAVADAIQLVSIVSVILAATLAGLFARTVVRPIQALSEATAQIGAGNLTASLPSAGDDEIGELTAQFAKMTDRLQATVGELQQRTLVIETSSEVSRRLSTILEEQELLNTVVNQLARGFNYYHVHIYLLNEQGDSLLMAAGTGQAAQEMLAQKHRLRLDDGLVGRAAQTRSVVLVPDVREEPSWLPNSLLPATKAEIAVPIISGDQLFGVLDVQHNQVNGLQGQDAGLLQLIANQIAIALQNARLFSQTQQQATQQAVINDIGRKIQTASTVERVLQIAAEELGQALGTQRTTIQLDSRGQKNGR